MQAAASLPSSATNGVREGKSQEQEWESYYAMVVASAPGDGGGKTVKRSSRKVYQASWLSQVRKMYQVPFFGFH